MSGMHFEMLVDATRVPVQRKYWLKLCKQKIVNMYLLESPRTGASKPRTTKTLSVNVTKPFNHLRVAQAKENRPRRRWVSNGSSSRTQ